MRATCTIARAGLDETKPWGAGARHIVFLAVLTIAALLAWAHEATAGRVGDLPTLRPGDAKAGSLLFKGVEEDRYVEAPRLGIDVDLTVSGPTIRARITQIFHNPTDGWVEAVYVYPLPGASGVDTLKMVIGERIVVGDIKERQTARVIYERAKADGKKATLIEQERPNIFTNSVANIGPGETVLVQIEYQEPVRQSGDEFSLRVPLVVGPRYNPAPVVQTAEFGGAGWGQAAEAKEEDRPVVAPVLDPRLSPPVNPVSIRVALKAGFPLGEVKSHHHAVKIEDGAGDSRSIAVEGAVGDTRTVTLAGGSVPADRDFELTWKAAPAKAPSVGLFKEKVGDAEYLLAFITPPALEAVQEQRPREIVLVIDNSGSMGGTSIVQAKASLIYALDRLKPTDRFNVIHFDDSMDVLFGDTVMASAGNIARAKAFVGALKANGGTEMIPPMKAALTDQRGPDSEYLRQVVFLTDGGISNEQQLLDTISSMRGRSRVFMVGIGSAPNSFLMTRASEIGRGTFTHIGSVEQVEERMRNLFEKLESPAVTNLSASFSADRADVTPDLIPDLYRGEPIVLAARAGSLDGTLEVNGRVGDRPWSVSLPLAKAADGKGLSKLWARRKITDAEVARTLRRMTADEADKAILSLALEHHLVTRLTSLVAVDQTPSRPEGARLTRADIPLNLPAGWDFDKVFGEKPRRSDMRRAEDGAEPVRVAAQGEHAIAVASKPQTQSASSQNAVTLPKTATDADLRMMAGLILFTLGLLLLAVGSRRPRQAM
jgi:Ca-activated chloride channel homolog